MPFTQEERDAWRKKVTEQWENRTAKFLQDTEEPQLNDYYSNRQDESTNAGLVVGICILLCAIIYLISIVRF